MGATKKIEIELGMEVKDAVTGFKGIATAMTQFLNGCERVSVDPPVDKKGEHVEGRWFDIQQLVILKKTTPARKLYLAAIATGGPRPDATRRADCPR